MTYFYLRDLRLRRGLTQVQLAKKSGVAQNVISRYERNRHADPPLRTVVDLARVLRVNPLRLRFGPAPRRRPVVDKTVSGEPPAVSP